jgi:TetR/AcrR family transcriptional regulator, regulator of cefoperazone and chloramphenicol sensitivity
MNEPQGTVQAILVAARDLFARHGYDGASIRAITTRAGVNLGAVTYHFGSKEQLYLAVMASSSRPLLDRIATAGAGQTGALDRIEAVLRCVFAHFEEFREAGSLMLQEISLKRSFPPHLRLAMEGNIEKIAGFIREGQRDGSIVPGDATLLALSVVAQPLYYTLARDPLRDVIGVDRDDPETQTRVVDHVVAFVRRGLATEGRNG